MTRWLLKLAMLMIASSPQLGVQAARAETDVLVIGGQGRNCLEDPQCINRLHPAIPMTARARPGQTLVLRTRNASDFDLDPASDDVDPRAEDPESGTVHPLTGPVYIEGAQPGDLLAVTLLDIAPGPYGYTSVSPIGFVSDHVRGALRVLWRLDRSAAVTDDIPGVRIPNASFPGILTTLPGPTELDAMLSREAELRAAGGRLRTRRHPRARMPADPSTAGARRQPRHPLSQGRRHRLSALLSGGLRSGGR
ncbi:MAG: acetamidase/formamidase family protein [Pseudomonadales bacterium]|nr:acetamidase/formamidase family protein [Pseudomonadales bacterium]